jgi:hypothetical protein
LDAPLVDVEFLRDVRPILQRSCVPCHTESRKDPPGDLVLDDLALVDGLPGDYYRLAADSKARFGYPPVIDGKSWRGTNASRYVRKFQSRRSLLVWKIFGERLDGWTNEDHPTESVPGRRGSLPPGTDPDRADLDFTGSSMPPPTSGVAPLTEEEKLTIVRWIDLGAPIDLSVDGTESEGLGWYLDDLRPTLTVTRPRPGVNREPVEEILIGAFDAYSGLDPSSMRVELEVGEGRRARSTELTGSIKELGDGVYSVSLPQPLASVDRALVQVEVRDRQGNRSVVEREFAVDAETRRSIGGRSTVTGGSAREVGADPRTEERRDRKRELPP